MKLRPYQQELFDGVAEAHAEGIRNVLVQLPTGGGKTAVFSKYIRDFGAPSVAIAHRQELVTQMSLTLARNDVRHRIVGPQNVVKLAVRLHMEGLGRSWFDPQAQCAVAGVDTLIRRGKQLSDWLPRVKLWVVDEAHHVVRGNKWGVATEMFPNALGLGVTATPCRADGKGLGRHADGVFDLLLEGPPMRRLIEEGFLTDYRILAPSHSIDMAAVPVGASGDWSQKKLAAAARKSRIVGDVVEHYLKHAAGKLGVTFVTDVETARDVADQFAASGVPAAALSADTPDKERFDAIRRFRRRELMQLVNVDLFGEGFDLPAIEVVSMARPTQSYGLYAQQFGRALRPLEGKDRALLLDHVGNVERHLLPDGPREWTLDRRAKRSAGTGNDGIPIRVCPSCCGAYERIHKACPYCGFEVPPQSRSGPEFVDGDLAELDAAALARLRGEAELPSEEQYGKWLSSRHVPELGHLRAMRLHRERLEAQAKLRDAIERWGAEQRARGRPDSESYRRFWHSYGVDVLTAQTKSTEEMRELARILLTQAAIVAS